MKKNIYKCKSCHHKIHTADREEGVTPMMLACTKKGCEGMAMSSGYQVNQNDLTKPELIFIKPQNEEEWNAIRKDTKETLLIELDDEKKRKVMDIFYNVMKAIGDHVSQGGLVPLPASTIAKFDSVQFHQGDPGDEHTPVRGANCSDIPAKATECIDCIFEEVSEFKKTRIFKVLFGADKTEWIQAKSATELLEEYQREYGEDVDDITDVIELSKEEAEDIVLKSNEPELAEEFTLWSSFIDDGSFVILGTTDYDW